MSNRPPGQRIRVLIVEDSRAQRELLVRLLDASGKFEVVGTAVNGQEGIEAAQRLQPDVIAMDIHLPIMDGYEATRQIMQSSPRPIVMVSSSMGDEGRRSVEALAAGALAVIRKPGSMSHDDYEQDRTTLIRTLQLMADVPVVTRLPPRIPRISRIETQFVNTQQLQVLAIAASTGGPAAIQTVLSGLGKNFPLPILLVQHIARGFTEALVDWLNATIQCHVKIAKHEERMRPGCVYLSPDDYHLSVIGNGIIGLRKAMSFDRFCPSADVLFGSIASVYGKTAIGIILTGMGDDGSQGLRAMYLQGAKTFAQDEASCVVYGMPQAAVAAGAVSSVVTLERMSQTILYHLGITMTYSGDT